MRRQGYVGHTLMLMLATFAFSLAVKGQDRQSTRQSQASPSSTEFSMRALRAEPGKPHRFGRHRSAGPAGRAEAGIDHQSGDAAGQSHRRLHPKGRAWKGRRRQAELSDSIRAEIESITPTPH